MRKPTYYILTAIVTMTCLGNAYGQVRASGNAFADAVSDYISGNIGKAKASLKQITSVTPDNDAAWYYLGLCFLAEKDPVQARASLAKAAGMDSTNYWYRDALISTYDPAEDIDLTIARYEQLLRDFPEKTDRQYVLLNLYMTSGETDKALALIDDIEGRDGKTDASVMTRASILRSTDKIEQSYQIMKEYVSEYSSPYVLSVLGEYEMDMYNDKEALGYFKEALSLDSSYYPAKLGCAETYRLTRDYESYFTTLKEIMADPDTDAENKAKYLVEVVSRDTDGRFIKAFRRQMDTIVTLAADTHPKDSVMLQTASSYYVYTGDVDTGLSYAKTRCGLYPRSRAAAYAYIQILGTGEDWSAVSEACREARGRFPDEDGFIELDSYAKYNQKDYHGVLDNAQILLGRAAGDSSKTLSALSTMGDMYHLTGENKSAYKAYDKALKVNPEYAPVLNNYAWYLCQEGRQLGKALKMSRRTIELEPKNATYLDTYGWILHLTGKTLEAKLFFKQAMLYGGKESATILAHYIVILEALGENDLADVYRSQLKNLPKDAEQ